MIDWEIKASLDVQMGLVVIKRPTLPVIGDASHKPACLHGNVDSGCAQWTTFEAVIYDHRGLKTIIEGTMAMPKTIIVNHRPMIGRNV